MVLDQSVNNTWKNNSGGLYLGAKALKENKRRIHQRYGKTWENLSQDAIRNAIDLQPKIMEAIIAAEGGRTSYMSSGVAKS